MLASGLEFDGLKIGSLLGRGAMGEVYRGEQTSLQRPVAIKRIADHLVDNPEAVARFTREAQCIALLQTQHVVQIYEFRSVTDADNKTHHLLVMELVEGGCNVQDVLEGGLSWQQAMSIIAQVVSGLVIAQEHGVVHRDIKPDNIMLSQKGVAKLCDFGLARAVDSTAMTMEGSMMGTPNYMAPEACLGEEIGGAADIYSLGATWYHLLCGRPPFVLSNTMALLRAHIDEQADDVLLHAEEVPPQISSLVMKCLAKDKDARPSNAAALHAEIVALQQEHSLFFPTQVPELVTHAEKHTDSKTETTMATQIALDNSKAVDSDAATLLTEAQVNPNVGQSTNADTLLGESEVAQRQEIEEVLDAGVAGVAKKQAISHAPQTAPHKTSPLEAREQSSSSLKIIIPAALVVLAVSIFAWMQVAQSPEDIPDQNVEIAKSTELGASKVKPTLVVADTNKLEQAKAEDVPDSLDDSEDKAEASPVYDVSPLKAALARNDLPASQKIIGDAPPDVQLEYSDQVEALAAEIKVSKNNLAKAMAADNYEEIQEARLAAEIYPSMQSYCAKAKDRVVQAERAWLANLHKAEKSVRSNDWGIALKALNEYQSVEAKMTSSFKERYKLAREHLIAEASSEVDVQLQRVEKAATKRKFDDMKSAAYAAGNAAAICEREADVEAVINKVMANIQKK